MIKVPQILMKNRVSRKYFMNTVLHSLAFLNFFDEIFLKISKKKNEQQKNYDLIFLFYFLKLITQNKHNLKNKLFHSKNP